MWMQLNGLSLLWVGLPLNKKEKGGLGYKLDNWSKTTRLQVKKRKSHFRTQFSCL